MLQLLNFRVKANAFFFFYRLAMMRAKKQTETRRSLKAICLTGSRRCDSKNPPFLVVIMIPI